MMILIMAWRNIWRNQMRSMVIIFSIAVGLFAGIAVLALYKGMMNSRIHTVIYSEAGHLQLHHKHFKDDYDPGFLIINGNQILKSIEELPAVSRITSRSVTNGMLSTTTGSSGVQINGIVPQLENMVSQLNKKITKGNGFEKGRDNEILIGKKLADKMKVKLRSKVVLTFTDTTQTIVSGAFRVAAIYQSANTSLDEINVFVDMNDLNALLATGNNFHEIVVILHHDDDVETIQSSLRQKYPMLLTESWKELSPETDLMVKTVNQYSYIIVIIIMIALAFGIINTMLMAILERTKEIGIMLALGTTRVRVFLLILLETLFLTLAGTPFGLLISWLVIGHYHRSGLDLSGMGKEMMGSFGFATLVYPEFPVDKLVGVLLIVISTAFISCLIPAAKALRLRPVEALRI